MRTLIVNADDFGLTPGVSRGILDAGATGIVTSTTVLVNRPIDPELIARLRAAAGPTTTVAFGSVVPAAGPSAMSGISSSSSLPLR